MDYKKEILKIIVRFPYIKPWEMIKLNRYFLEYARQLAETAGIDTIKEYKRTSKLIKHYSSKGATCLGDTRVIFDAYDQIAKTQTQYDDSDSLLGLVVTEADMEQIRCLVALMNAPN